MTENVQDYVISDVDDANNKIAEATSWTNPPKLVDLKQDITDAMGNHTSEITKIKEWLDVLRVEGAEAAPKRKNRSSVQPKLVRKHAEWRYSALTEAFMSTPDLFAAEPKTFEDREAAFQNGLLLNYQFNKEMNKVKFIDEYVRTVVDNGTLIAKVAWESETQPDVKKVPIFEYYEDDSEEYHQLLAEVDQIYRSNPQEYNDLPEELKAGYEYSKLNGLAVTAEIVGEEEVEYEKTLVNRPVVEICDAEHVIIDPACGGDIDRAKFIVHIFPTCLGDLQKDGRYENLDRIDLASNSILGSSDSLVGEKDNSFNFKDKARQQFYVYEYWGLWDINNDNRLVPVVVSWVGDLIIRIEENPYPFRTHPFCAVPYLPKTKSIYGETDAELLKDNQRILGAVTRGMIDLMGRSANSQRGVRKDALDITNKRKFERGEDYEFNPNVNPDQAFYTHKFPEIPNSAEFMIGMQNVDAEALSGVKAFHGGLGSDALGKVATGIRGVLDAASKRELGILRRLAKGLTDIANKIIAMNQAFMDDEQIIRVTNERFVAIRREDLAGNFDIRLTISTAEEDDAKASELAFMLQTTGNSMDFNITKMILTDIARLRRMPDLAKKIEEYNPEPDPRQEYLLDLEIRLKEAELEIKMAEAQQKMAIAMEKGAKADNIRADTDKKSSEFVDRVSGKEHQQTLERIGEQARSQADLKVLEHSLKQSGEERKGLIDAYIARIQNRNNSEEE